MQYFFVYLFIIILNIVAVLAVLRVRRKRQNDPNVITDVQDSDLIYDADFEDEVKKPRFSRFSRKTNNLTVGFNDIAIDDREFVYGGDLLDLAVEKEVIKKNGFSVPIGRYGTSEEVAALVVFLCSNAASYINGSAIEVDGGQAGHI